MFLRWRIKKALSERKDNVMICPRCGFIRFRSETTCKYCGSQFIDTGITINMYIYQWDTEQRTSFQKEIREKYCTSDSFSPEAEQMRLEMEAEENRYWEEKGRQIAYERDHPKCPRCGSEAITAGSRGWNPLFGFFGSDDTINHCANCGYKWQPRR